MEKIMVTRASMPAYEEYAEAIRPLWDSHWLTNMGSFHKQLEQELSIYLGVPWVSLMVNGHMSLEMAIQAYHFPKGAEVITTPFTFISTIHAIVRNGLIPVFCDIKLSDYTIDEGKIENLITEKTVAILPVHVYGNICNVEEIERIAYKYSLKVIYDAAHAFGESYKGIPVGRFGDASVFSFHATKVFNSIEGGAVCSDDETLYQRLYNLKNFGIRGEELVVEVGANAKMNEFCAIMGLCNLKHMDEYVEKRKERVDYYMDSLMSIEGIMLPVYKEEISYSYGYFPVIFEKKEIRNQIYDVLKAENIYSRKYFYPLASDEACFKNKYKELPLENARHIAGCVLVLPLYPELLEKEQERIVEIIKSYLAGEYIREKQ